MIFYYYIIENSDNNKKYIGVTTRDFNIRKKERINLLNKNTHPNYRMQADWNLNKDAFNFSLIEYKKYENIDEGYRHEYELIKEYKKGNNLYNLAVGGKINPMYSPQIKEKMTKTKQAQVPNIYQLKEIEENCFALVKMWNSQKEAQRVGKYSQGNIFRAMKNHTKYRDYYWVSEKDFLNNLKEWKPKRIKPRPTAKYSEDEKIIEVHHNPVMFEKEIGETTSGILARFIRKKKKFKNVKYDYISEDMYYSLKPIILLPTCNDYPAVKEE